MELSLQRNLQGVYQFGDEVVSHSEILGHDGFHINFGDAFVQGLGEFPPRGPF